MSKLTARQQQIFDFIREHMTRHGCPPTRAEIAMRFGFRSPNASEAHLRALAKKGVIELLSGLSRGIRLTQPQAVRATVVNADFPRHGSGLQQLPLIGRVAAGSPVLAAENIEEHFAIDANLFHPRPQYLLRVLGSSMIEAGIMDGDLLAVHRTPEASNGQIVVARLDEEVTVKRYTQRGGKVRLLPANATHKPIVVDLKQQSLAIEGLAVGVIRNKLTGL